VKPDGRPRPEPAPPDRLGTLAVALAGAATVDEVAAAIVEHAAAAVGADHASVAVAFPDRPEMELHEPADPDLDLPARRRIVPADQRTVLGEVISLGRPLRLEGADEVGRRFPGSVADAWARTVETLEAHPLTTTASPLQAAIGLGWAPAVVDDRDLTPVLSLCGAALKRAWEHDELAATAALLDLSLRQAPIGLALLDAQLRFSHVNEQLAEMNGVAVVDHLGKSPADVVPEIHSRSLPHLQQVLSTGRAVTTVEIEGETPASPGEQRVWRSSYYPVHGSSGATLGIGVVVEEVTEARRAQQELANLAARLRLALRIANGGVFEWRPDTGATDWTPEFATLIGVDEATRPSYETWLDRILAEDRATIADLAERLRLGHDIDRFAYRLDHPDRGRRWIETVVHVHRDASGAPTSVTGISVDITERRRQELRRDAQLRHEARLAHALQVGLLPSSVPPVPGWEVSVRYLAGTEGLEVGGDWYDLVEVTPTDFALVVGDVVGHDLRAAIAMSQFRNALAGLSHAHADPAAVLRRLDDYAVSVAGLADATVFYGRLQPETGMLRYSTAGHPPALVVRQDGQTGFLADGRAAPVGTSGGRTTATCAVAVGDTVVCYTDGLVERRGELITDGMERLRALVASSDPAEPLEALTARLLDELPGSRRDDDIAVLALRRRSVEPVVSAGAGRRRRRRRAGPTPGPR
jgi:phosphoserine phosphatase RsbU/P